MLPLVRYHAVLGAHIGPVHIWWALAVAFMTALILVARWRLSTR